MSPSFSGATGLFMTHESMRISLPLALWTSQAPWPSHVKLTSAFSAMRGPSCLETRGRSDLKTEKAILPQGQHEGSNCCDGPEVREDEVARLPIETEQAGRKDAEGNGSPPLDRTHSQQQDQREKRKPLVGPDLVPTERAKGDTGSPRLNRPPSKQQDRREKGRPLEGPGLVRNERAKGETDCHSIRWVPSASPGGPCSAASEEHRAHVGEDQRQGAQVQRRRDHDDARSARLEKRVAADRTCGPGEHRVIS